MADDARIQALEQQLQTLQAQLAAATAQPVQPVAQQPTQPGPFALTPALANQNAIDLSSSQGIKLYKAITTPLATKFDGSSRKLVLFMDELRHKADEYGWNHTLLSVSDQHPITPTNRNLLLHHRLITMDNVRAHATVYIGTQQRVAQDSNMMYVFLRDSLTEGARSRMANEHEKYDINGTPDGPCYLKTILVTYFVETIATNFLLRQKLQALPDAIKQHKYNVGSFNAYVNELVQNLAQGGEVTSDLMVYLFTAYEQVNDQSFHTYIAHKKEAYEEGSEQMTVTTLMNLALTKYNLLAHKKSWLKKSPEEEQMVALAAQLKQAKAKIEGLSNASTSSSKADGITTSTRTGKTGWRRYAAWHFENPGGLTTLVKDGKTWYWCKWHKCWGTHPDVDCEARKRHQQAEADNKDKASDKTHPTPRKGKKDKRSKDKALSLAKALIAIQKFHTKNDYHFYRTDVYPTGKRGVFVRAKHTAVFRHLTLSPSHHPFSGLTGHPRWKTCE
jgi:hypothetical protein